MRERRHAAGRIAVALGLLGLSWVSGCSSGDGGTVGPVSDCQAMPAFLSDVGLAQPVLIDTSQQLVTGLAIRESSPEGRFYQHPTWDDAGNVGPYAIDSRGHIYVAPVPLVSLWQNRPEDQNVVYRVDSATGEMAPLARLPWAESPSGANPFGAVGLAYDCETDSLYAASLAGSTPAEERGRLYRIDPQTGDVVAQLDGVDALGLGVFRGASGKRLYYGRARRPEVHSVALDEGGDFVGEPRFEFSLATLPGSSFDKVTRIRFAPDGTMKAKGVEFSYSLKASSDPRSNVYTLRYDPDEDRWALLSVDAG